MIRPIPTTRENAQNTQEQINNLVQKIQYQKDYLKTMEDTLKKLQKKAGYS